MMEARSAMQTPDLERRARVHAALGEPMRLAIVDSLALTDAASGELGRGLGISTNLLAHHLRVLEDAGLILRIRSEGDRRRTYVRLRLDDLIVAALSAGSVWPWATSANTVAPGISRWSAVTSAPRVVFVCTRNSARSQLAAAAWGTTTARTQDVLRTDDLVVAVCDNAHEELAPADAPARLHWSVPDPVRIDTEEAFEAAYQDLAVRVDRLAHAMTRTSSRPRRAPVPGNRRRPQTPRSNE
jgi:protein-tyrosine-phosphatase/DNA-binding transcriptional ArsR family regulator